MARNIFATISSAALAHNFNQVRKIVGNKKIISMVKANAYGHGLRTVATALQETDAFGVASIHGALKLRQANFKQPIILMEGCFYQDELPIVEQQQLIMVLHHPIQVEYLEKYNSKTKLPVWIKINSGMNRLGFNFEDFEKYYEIIAAMSHVEIIGFMTHFPQADEINNDITAKQAERFNKLVANKPGLKSLANSAAIISWPNTHGDWVRPGLMLYGASPFIDKTGLDYNLQPAMTLSSEIIAIRNLNKNDKVGYGGTWQASQDNTKVGVVAIGYGDGYPWHAQTGTPVLVNNILTKTLGRVSMDMMAVDLSPIPDAKITTPVTLWGDGLPVEEVAQAAGTIPYELLCKLTDRVNFRVI